MIWSLITIALLTLTGMPAVARARPLGIAGSAGLAFLLGSGTAAFSLLLLEAIGVSWSRAALLVTTPFLSLIAMVACARAAARNEHQVTSDDRSRWLALPFDLLTLLLIAGHAVRATLAPVWQWDFWMIWGMKARAFAEEGGIDWRLLQDPLQNEAIQPAYPLLLPLVLDVDTLIRGAWDDRNAALLFTAFAAAALLVIRDLLAQELRSGWRAGAGTLALAGTALSGWVGTAEIPLIAFATTGVLLVRNALRIEKEGGLPFAALLLGFGAATKLEGMTFLAALFAALLMTQRFRAAIRLSPALAIAAVWPLLLLTHPVEKLYFARGGAAERMVARLSEAPALGAQLVTTIDRPFLVAALLATFLLYSRTVVAKDRFLVLTLAGQLLCFLGAYLVTPYDVQWHIANSWPRLSQQLLLPAAFLAAALLLASGHDRAADGSA